jgi:hypothetical protein
LLLAFGAAVSLLDFGIRFNEMHARAGAEIRAVMVNAMTVQLASNIAFQIALPAVLGFTLAALVGELRRA